MLRSAVKYGLSAAEASLDVTYERGQAEGAAPDVVEEVPQQAAGNEADTTHDPPYTIGCYHEEVEWALQIEPRQMRDLGEFGRNATEIVSLTVDEDVRTLLFKTDRGELNAIVYQLKSGQL